MKTQHDIRMTKPGTSLKELIDSIPFFHHQVLRQKLASLNRVLQRIAANHVVPITAMDRFERQFLTLADKLETNWEEQECWLFAWLRRLIMRQPGIRQDNYLEESLSEAMDQAATANQEALDAVARLQMFLCDPQWVDKGALVEELMDRLRDLEEGLVEYEHLEREELFPRVREWIESAESSEPDGERGESFRRTPT